MKSKYFEDEEVIGLVFNEEGSTLGDQAVAQVKEELKNRGEKHGNVYFINPYDLKEAVEKVGGILNVKLDFDAKKAVAKAKAEADKELKEAKEKGETLFIGIPSDSYAKQTEAVKLWNKLTKSIYFSVFRDSDNKAYSRYKYSATKKDVIRDAKKKGIEFVIGDFIL